MAKGKTNIIGLTLNWRRGKTGSSFRVGVLSPKGDFFWISGKIDHGLKDINLYIKLNKVTESTAKDYPELRSMMFKLYERLRSEHGLKEYKTREYVSLKTKSFNFEESLESFVLDKEDTSVPMIYKSHLKNFWLPFFITKGCKHPREFKIYRKAAELHLKTAKKLDGVEKYSVNSLPNIACALNQYLEFLAEYEFIAKDDAFKIIARFTLEQKKRSGTQGTSARSRSRDTYNLEEVLAIKNKIDKTYSDDLPKKLKAYALYLGICTGLRRGNLLGMSVDHLHPNAKPVPYFETADNVVEGWGRGIKGTIRLKSATKTFVGTIKLPFIQPSIKVVCEVANFLQKNMEKGAPLIDCKPGQVGKRWKAVASDCGFKNLTPHQWKHSYATIGAAQLQKMYGGDPQKLMTCCLHEKYETTKKYIDQTGDEFLKGFAKLSTG